MLSRCLRQLLEADADGGPHTDRQHRPDILDPHIAAKLDALPAAFTLGDEKTYNSYYNRALPGRRRYVCFVLAELMHHESVSRPVHSSNEWHYSARVIRNNPKHQAVVRRAGAV